MISIKALDAKKLSNPTDAEELTRYEEEVSQAILEAATAGIKEITLRIPLKLRDSIIAQLADLGYSYYAIGQQGEMIFYKVNWI